MTRPLFGNGIFDGFRTRFETVYFETLFFAFQWNTFFFKMRKKTFVNTKLVIHCHEYVQSNARLFNQVQIQSLNQSENCFIVALTLN